MLYLLVQKPEELHSNRTENLPYKKDNLCTDEGGLSWKNWHQIVNQVPYVDYDHSRTTFCSWKAWEEHLYTLGKA